MKNRKLLIIVDFIAIIYGMLFGYIIRFSLQIFPYKGIPPLIPYIQLSIFAAIVWITLLNINRTYKDQTFINPCFELSRIIQSSFYSYIIISAVTFLYRGFSYSRIAVSLGAIISFMVLSLIHLLISSILARSETKFFLIGNKEDFLFVSKRLRLHGARFIRIITPDQFINSDEIHGEKNVCAIICLENLGKIQQIEQICNKFSIPYFIYPKTSQIFLSGGRVEEIDGIPVITKHIFPLEFWHNRIIKRFSDIFISMISLAALMPFLFLVSIAIKLDSRGPAVFVQKRIGFRGKKFKILKFRTMVHGAETILPYTIKQDPRITGFGKFLRRFNIDELPQLLNVLKGDMSLVGPRPISINDTLFFSIPGFYERSKIMPGMTGWAQIHGLRGGQIEPEERFSYDLYYAENWSIWLDFAIIIFTMFLFFTKNKGG